MSVEWVTLKFAQALEPEESSMLSEMQCRSYISSHHPDDFTVKFDGCLPSQTVEVAIKRSLLQKLPLLKDVQSSTPDGEGIPAPADLPCTVWGLVSLLILLGGGVGMDQWFGGDPTLRDPSLPANTMLAASFMGCTRTVFLVSIWLHKGLRNVADPEYSALGSPHSSHRLKMLRFVPPEHECAVFESDVVDIEAALNLPASLLSKLITYGLDIDLPFKWLSVESWVKLVSAICQAPHCAVKNLGVVLPPSDDEQWEAMSSIIKSSLRNIVAHTTHLSIMSIFSECTSADQVSFFSQLLSECPGSLSKLLLMFLGDGRAIDVEVKNGFFVAVTHVQGLRELHMPRWKSFFGLSEHVRASAPLRSIPGLKIFVDKCYWETQNNTCWFPSGLAFHAYEK